jgi:hypothetical protein
MEWHLTYDENAIKCEGTRADTCVTDIYPVLEQVPFMFILW